MARLILLSVLLMSSLAVRAQSTDTADVPAIKQGDSWTYSRSDKLDRTRAATYSVTVKSVSASEYETSVEVLQGTMASREDRYTKESNPVFIEGQKFEPFVPVYSFPLSPGKQWDGKYSWWSATANNQLSGSRRARVVGWETVKTPAGEFKALKITAETQIMGRGGFGSSAQITQWYAPEVRRVVRVESKGFGGAARDEVIELVSYKLAQ